MKVLFRPRDVLSVLVLDIYTWTRGLLVMVGVFAGRCWW